MCNYCGDPRCVCNYPQLPKPVCKETNRQGVRILDADCIKFTGAMIKGIMTYTPIVDYACIKAKLALIA